MRYLLKLSGEALQNNKEGSFDHEYIMHLCSQVCDLVKAGNQIAIVNGGGNIARGKEFAQHGMLERTGHSIGMLATTINAVVLQDAIARNGVKSKVFTARNVETVGELFDATKVIEDLESGVVTILSGGSGNPYFTTDTASALRSLELECDMMVKCTNVDGLYDSDPQENPQAKKFDTVSYDEVIEKNLRVMDQTAIALARDNGLKVAICHIDSISQLSAFSDKSFQGTIVS